MVDETWSKKGKDLLVAIKFSCVIGINKKSKVVYINRLWPFKVLKVGINILNANRVLSPSPEHNFREKEASY